VGKIGSDIDPNQAKRTTLTRVTSDYDPVTNDTSILGLGLGGT
jgi:hypothetical protein